MHAFVSSVYVELAIAESTQSELSLTRLPTLLRESAPLDFDAQAYERTGDLVDVARER